MSFEFRDLHAYRHAMAFHTESRNTIKALGADRHTKDQLTRASLSIILNLAEGYGRFHPKEKKNFYVTARASLNECVACIDVLYANAGCTTPQETLDKAEMLGRLLSGLIKVFKDT